VSRAQITREPIASKRVVIIDLHDR